MSAILHIFRIAGLTCMAIALLCAVAWAVSGWGGVACVWKQGSMSIGNGAVEYHRERHVDPDVRNAGLVWRRTDPPSWFSVLEVRSQPSSAWLMIPLWHISLSIASLGAAMLFLSRRRKGRQGSAYLSPRRLWVCGEVLVILALFSAACWKFSGSYVCRYTRPGSAYSVGNGRFAYGSSALSWNSATDGWEIFGVPRDATDFRSMYFDRSTRFDLPAGGWPLWPIPVTLAALGGTLLYIARKPSPFGCPVCSYDRRGIPPNTPCPECGTNPKPTEQPT